LKILLLVDNLPTAESIRLCLKVLDPDTIVERCGKSKPGFQLLATGLYDCAIIDLDYPVLSGIDAIKDCFDHVCQPAVIISNLSDWEASKLAASLGIDGYLSKPFKYHQLIERIELAIKHNKAHSPDYVAR